uniref:Uncharacterized protein n=1 Tax=Nelumbo nucifera TaxID=4432 RepID=A0A822ZT06_NELNU|nr:TPA_asm: hypothetical protein HUJ06_017954 [Nelumbo nucifera]
MPLVALLEELMHISLWSYRKCHIGTWLCIKSFEFITRWKKYIMSLCHTLGKKMDNL